MSETAIYAAGAVCWRFIDGKLHILVVHRTAQGDVTIPKGKVDPGETLPQTAVREIAEETGLAVHLGASVAVSRYRMPNGREKIVHYWSAKARESAILHSTFRPNSEIAAIEWVTLKRARTYLTYKTDVAVLDAFEQLVAQDVTETFSLIVLRHGKARSRGTWSGADVERPLVALGVREAAALVPTVAAWGPKRIVTSDATRCVATVMPLAAALTIDIRREAGLGQAAHENGNGTVRRIVGKRVRSGKTAVLCTHRPVLPDVLREIALATGTPLGSYLDDAAALEPGGFSVVHLSKTNPASGIISIETYPPRT
ncbi:NUDIX domain-containing protein [Agromyces seonyuensis]|uniref:NUDIX domain-containing protein n=1 Tax=Agromyces seonyuensis TaxID=2662446 RepID=A0A6I4NZ42_9MICO|nr:NUDIX domain-containing protein [Agromyces seonyuensis]